jgi:DNA-binding IclR family transcriptional regulator
LEFAMVRPALSASRGFDILELLALAPAQGLTLSDVARATGINPASCHSVLGVLSERGYIARDLASRRFTLGPLPVALGQSALAAQPLLERARSVADRMAEETDLPVLISAAIGGDIVGIHVRSDKAGRLPGLLPGERRAMLPPLGAPFLAWAGDDAIEAWLAKAPAGEPPQATDERRRGMATIRARGCEVLVQSTATSRLASEMAALAAKGANGANGADDPGARFHTLGPKMALPEELEPERFYDISLIAAPVFNAAGVCLYNICLGPFPDPLNGAAIIALGEALMRACLEAMRASGPAQQSPAQFQVTARRK